MPHVAPCSTHLNCPSLSVKQGFFVALSNSSGVCWTTSGSSTRAAARSLANSSGKGSRKRGAGAAAASAFALGTPGEGCSTCVRRWVAVRYAAAVVCLAAVQNRRTGPEVLVAGSKLSPHPRALNSCTPLAPDDGHPPKPLATCTSRNLCRKPAEPYRPRSHPWDA